MDKTDLMSNCLQKANYLIQIVDEITIHMATIHLLLEIYRKVELYNS